LSMSVSFDVDSLRHGIVLVERHERGDAPHPAHAAAPAPRAAKPPRRQGA
jgi:hypothetical protein